MNVISNKIIYFIILIFIKLQYIFNKLLFVAEHFRHGSRGVTRFLDSFDKDYFFNYWDKKGEITPTGMRMHYILGCKIRNKYKDFLPKIFDAKQFLFYSSDYNRTIESLYCQLNGIFPDGMTETLTEKQINLSIPPINLDQNTLLEIQENLKNHSTINQIQSFIIHTFHENDKIYLLDEEKSCIGIKPHKSKIINSHFFDDILWEFSNEYGAKLIKYGNNIKKSKLTNIRYVFHLCDHFLVDYLEGRDLSLFEKNGINLQNLFDSCIEISMSYLQNAYLGGAKNGEIAIMSISRLMRKIILNNMIKRADLAIKNKSDLIDYDSPKFLMISGHDNTVLANEMLLHYAFSSELIYPSYASNLFFELHQKDDVSQPKSYNDFYIVVIMNDKEILKVNFNDFIKRLENIMWDDTKISKFCKHIIVPNTTYKTLAFIFFYICLFLSIFIAVLCCKDKKYKLKNKVNYSKDISSRNKFKKLKVGK